MSLKAALLTEKLEQRQHCFTYYFPFLHLNSFIRRTEGKQAYFDTQNNFCFMKKTISMNFEAQLMKENNQLIEAVYMEKDMTPTLGRNVATTQS